MSRVGIDGRLWTSHYIRLLTINLLLCFGFYMLPPTLPAYVKQLGGSSLQMSLVFGMFSSMSMITRIISGNMIENRDEKLLILAGMFVVTGCTVAYAWIPVNGILLLRSFQGIGWGMATAAIATAVYKVIPVSRRGEGSGYYALTVILALSLTPLGAMLIMNMYSFVMVSGVSAMLTSLGMFILAPSLLGASSQRIPAGIKSSAISFKSLLERGAMLPSFLCFLLSIPLCGIMGYLMLLGQELNMRNIWIFFIGYTVMILLTRPFIGRLFDRKGHTVIIIPGSILMIAGLFVLSFTYSAAMLIVASVLYGLGYGAVQPSLQTWSVNRCPEDRKGAANGLFLSAIDLGYIIGSVILAYIAGIVGYAAMYRYAALFMVVFVIVYVFSLTDPKHPDLGLNAWKIKRSELD